MRSYGFADSNFFCYPAAKREVVSSLRLRLIFAADARQLRLADSSYIFSPTCLVDDLLELLFLWLSFLLERVSFYILVIYDEL